MSPRTRVGKHCSKRIYLSVIICSITAFFFHLFMALYRNIGFHQNKAKLCTVINNIVFITYGFSFFSVILFLWFRQRALYTAFLPMTRFTKPLKFFSFIIIFVTFFLVVVGIILIILGTPVISTSMGCLAQNENRLQLAIFVSTVSSIIFSQVSLLMMFIYALLSSQGFYLKIKWKSLFSCKRQSSNEEPANRTRIMVNKIIKKATVFSALSLLSDLLVVSLTIFYGSREGNRNEIKSVLASFAVSINLYFVILSFIAWKDMITSPCKSFCFQ